MDIPSQVEGSLLLPPTFGTVVARSQLAIVSLVRVFVKRNYKFLLKKPHNGNTIFYMLLYKLHVHVILNVRSLANRKILNCLLVQITVDS